jgi:F-type H+-transporting ATPase subunit epsilon
MLYAWQYVGRVMNFELNLFSSNQAQQFTEVYSFVGADESGSFGIQAAHADFMTVLSFGLSRFRFSDEKTWHYLALPSGLASFRANQLTISTRYYLIDTDFHRISHLLEQQALKEQENMYAIRESLQRMELAMLKKIRNLKHDIRWE